MGLNKDGDLTSKDVLGFFRWSVLKLSLSLSSGFYFSECGLADWSSVCGNSPFGVSCSVELGHN